jgi:hypothetical protein
MLELLFIDLPTGLFSYFAIVFLIMKYMGDRVHDVHTEGTPRSETISDVAKPLASESPSAKKSSPVGSDNPVQAVTTPEFKRPEHWPSDSVLVRHHLTQLIALANEAHPIERFDGTREAYQNLLRSLVEGMLEDPARIHTLELERRQQIHLVDSPSSETVIFETASLAANEPISYLPEDATLRRHALQLIVSRLEEHFPRPTDSTLIRHYEQWVDSELEKLKECA